MGSLAAMKGQTCSKRLNQMKDAIKDATKDKPGNGAASSKKGIQLGSSSESMCGIEGKEQRKKHLPFESLAHMSRKIFCIIFFLIGAVIIQVFSICHLFLFKSIIYCQAQTPTDSPPAPTKVCTEDDKGISCCWMVNKTSGDSGDSYAALSICDGVLKGKATINTASPSSSSVGIIYNF